MTPAFVILTQNGKEVIFSCGEDKGDRKMCVVGSVFQSAVLPEEILRAAEAMERLSDAGNVTPQSIPPRLLSSYSDESTPSIGCFVLLCV